MTGRPPASHGTDIPLDGFNRGKLLPTPKWWGCFAPWFIKGALTMILDD